jgi:hypothetical protein
MNDGEVRSVKVVAELESEENSAEYLAIRLQYSDRLFTVVRGA